MLVRGSCVGSRVGCLVGGVCEGLAFVRCEKGALLQTGCAVSTAVGWERGCGGTLPTAWLGPSICFIVRWGLQKYFFTNHRLRPADQPSSIPRSIQVNESAAFQEQD